MPVRKFTLCIWNTMLQNTRVREFVNLSEAVDTAEWIIRDNTPADTMSARLIAQALRVPGCTAEYAQYRLRIDPTVV